MQTNNSLESNELLEIIVFWKHHGIYCFEEKGVFIFEVGDLGNLMERGKGANSKDTENAWGCESEELLIKPSLL